MGAYQGPEILQLMDKSYWQGFLEYSVVLDVILFVLKLGDLSQVSWSTVMVIWATPPLLYLSYRIFIYFYFR